MVRFGERPVVPKHQVDATLSQDNPVSGTKYTVLDTIKNARIISIQVVVTWTVQPTPLEAHVTIDGVSMIFWITNPASVVNYFASLVASADEANQILETTDRAASGRPFLLEGKSVKVEVETTGGTVSNINARVKYAKY